MTPLTWSRLPIQLFPKAPRELVTSSLPNLVSTQKKERCSWNQSLTVFLAMPLNLQALSSLIGIEPGPRQWKHQVLTNGPQKTPKAYFVIPCDKYPSCLSTVLGTKTQVLSLVPLDNFFTLSLFLSPVIDHTGLLSIPPRVKIVLVRGQFIHCSLCLAALVSAFYQYA